MASWNVLPMLLLSNAQFFVSILGRTPHKTKQIHPALPPDPNGLSPKEKTTLVEEITAHSTPSG